MNETNESLWEMMAETTEEDRRGKDESDDEEDDGIIEMQPATNSQRFLAQEFDRNSINSPSTSSRIQSRPSEPLLASTGHVPVE